MKKIVFRQPKLKDLNAVYRWVKETETEDTFIMMNAKEPLTRKEVKDYILDQLKKAKQKKVIKIGLFEDKKYLGGCDIVRQGKRQGHVGLFGIVLSKECRGQGIGFKLAQQVIQEAKQKLGIKQVVLSCFANNKAGLNFYKKLGFIRCGRHPRAVLYKGKYIDTIRFYQDLWNLTRRNN